MSNMQSLADWMAESPDRPARVLDAVTGLRRISDGRMAELTGWSRPTVQGKRRGLTPVKPADVPVLSIALDLPIGVFMMTVPEALAWISENRAEWFPEVDDGDDGGPGAEVTTLHTPAGVVQWDYSDNLLEAA